MYLHDWKEGGFVQMVSDFEGLYVSKAEYESTEPTYSNTQMFWDKKRQMTEALALDKYVGIEILIASYTYEDYSGAAFVLFRRDGKLYEVTGSHWSCYGLEGLWSPEETSVEALRHRLDRGTFGTRGDNVFAEELRVILGQIDATGG